MCHTETGAVLLALTRTEIVDFGRIPPIAAGVEARSSVVKYLEKVGKVLYVV